MIISHRYQFIFIKTSKTAGTSLEIALSQFCGNADIITPLAAPDEALRKKLGYRCAQHYWAPISDYTREDWKNRFLHGQQKKRYFNHISAQEVKGFIGDKIWGN